MARTGSPMAGMSPSPQPQPMTKRDKRRNNITEKLSEMISTFSKDQHQHYRAQLQAIQVDMTLILRADPYENMPLDDSPQAIEELIEQVTGGSLPATKPARDDYLTMAGKRYYDYCQAINQAQEQRDADLTALKNRYDTANAELDRSTSFKLAVAQREHEELAKTTRQRLLNSVTRRRDRLMREKEQLDIADSSALLMHPSQFSMNVPASPGGAHSNRKTRHTRHRNGDAEEAAGERGRKRKVPGDDDAVESPVPVFKPLATTDLARANSPFQDQRQATLHTQFEASAYSIDRLFSEKELALASSTAQIATRQFFLQQQRPQESVSAPTPTNGDAPSVPSVDGSAEATAPVVSGTNEDGEVLATTGSPPQSQAAEMERTVSYHATRGATKANGLSALVEAAAVHSTTPALVNPFLPNIIPITKTDKGAPTPPPVNQTDVDSDLAMIFHDEPARASYSLDDNSVHAMRNKYLEQACRDTMTSQPFRMPLNEVGPAAIRDGVLRPPHFGFADPASIANVLRNGATSAPNAAAVSGLPAGLGVVGGFPMSRATSMGGSDMGAASEAGGVGMRRTRSRLA